MKDQPDRTHIETGVRNLDALLDGGLPRRATAILSGPPGSGKTILAQQICFHAASPTSRVLYFNTLSEPTAKTLRHLKPFAFFDPRKLARDLQFVDLGVILRGNGLRESTALVMDRVEKVQPSLVVIDSFKALEGLSVSTEEQRKLGYELAVHLMAWDVTALLLGEYSVAEYTTNPLFSVVDGLVVLSQRELAGEQRRLVQIVKMRGTHHSRDEHTFAIASGGVEVDADAAGPPPAMASGERLASGVPGLDARIGGGLLRRSATLIAGSAGTGKSTLGVQFVLEGARRNEPGILFALEEGPEQLLASAEALGLPLREAVEDGLVDLVYLAQPAMRASQLLAVLRETVAERSARRLVLDGVAHLARDAGPPAELRRTLRELVRSFKELDATTLLTLGTSSRPSVDEGTELDFSQLADNVLVLRHVVTPTGAVHAVMTVVKTRGSDHETGNHRLSIGRGGLALEGARRRPPRSKPGRKR